MNRNTVSSACLARCVHYWLYIYFKEVKSKVINKIGNKHKDTGVSLRRDSKAKDKSMNLEASDLICLYYWSCDSEEVNQSSVSQFPHLYCEMSNTQHCCLTGIAGCALKIFNVFNLHLFLPTCELLILPFAHISPRKPKPTYSSGCYPSITLSQPSPSGQH